ncbi:MAG: PTS sugar transporter subunit IIA [Gemmatimonadaceae bacterium]
MTPNSAGDATTPEVRAVVAGHGAYAAGMISAVAQIAGLAERFVAVSNTGLSPAALEEALRTALAESGARIVFTDLPAGSCTLAARRLARTDPGLTVVVGVALPTLLSFACGSDVATATERGRAAISVVEGPGDA